MRNFQTLDKASADDSTGIFYLTNESDTIMQPRVSLKREGSYVAISVSYGPLEIAMRLRYEELTRVLSRLRPVQGLQTTRQIGTGEAYLAMGLQGDETLVVRPTIVADATGHLCFNLLLTNDVRQALYSWLSVERVQA